MAENREKETTESKNNENKTSIDQNGDVGREVSQLAEKIDRLYEKMHYGHIAEYVRLMNEPRRLFLKSLISGIGRGVGIAIGLTVFLVSLLYFLRALGALNLPIIGDYIADIVEIVQNQLQLRNY